MVVQLRLGQKSILTKIFKLETDISLLISVFHHVTHTENTWAWFSKADCTYSITDTVIKIIQ